MINAIPHLSVDGWIDNPSIMVGKIFEYFIVSEYSQSNTFRGHITSLKYILEHNNTATEIQSAITKDLTIMYDRYYPTTAITVTTNTTETSIDISIDVLVTDTEGKTHQLNQNLATTGGVLVNTEEAVDNIYKV